MESPKISVIVPIYNVSRFLPECIESVINQTYDDFELILVDDGSTDDSGDICDNYAKADNRIRVIHKPNGGLTSARNAGLSISSGEWIMHLDGDDYLENNAIEELLKQASTSVADLVIGDFRFVNEASDYLDHGAISQWTDDKVGSLNRYISSTWTCIWGSIAKKHIYSVNKLASPENIAYGEDFYLIVRLCYYANKVVNCRKELYNYRQRDTSMLHNKNEKYTYDQIRVYNETIALFKAQGVYASYKKSLNWRMLHSLQELSHKSDFYKHYQRFYVGRRIWILSCPLIRKRLRVRMFLLSCQCTWPVLLYDRMAHVNCRTMADIHIQ